MIISRQFSNSYTGFPCTALYQTQDTFGNHLSLTRVSRFLCSEYQIQQAHIQLHIFSRRIGFPDEKAIHWEGTYPSTMVFLLFSSILFEGKVMQEGVVTRTGIEDSLNIC